MGKSKSQTKKAIDARRWRSNAKEKRQFNALIAEYVQYKHSNIYDECSQLYKSLCEKHPNAQNIVKTRTFKRIIEDFKEAANEEEEPVAAAEDLTVDRHVEEKEEPVANEADQHEEPVANEPVANEAAAAPVANEAAAQSIISAALEESLGYEHVNINEINNIENIENIINEVINDLEQDEVIRDMMDQYVQPQYEIEDEGIGLNLEDEIIYDIEPFDYALKVEPFDIY